MNSLFRKLVMTLAIMFGMTTPAVADDIEIFFNALPITVGDPMVMFSLDWRPNLTSTICNFTYDASDSDRDYLDPCSSGDVWSDDIKQAFFETDLSDGTVDFLEILRASLRVVLDEVSDVKVGLMLNHDYINNCENNPVAGCSNGGYIAMGFQGLDEVLPAGNDTNLDSTSYMNGREKLLYKLGNIPSPQGTASHAYQGKELYFEFFRYLTGQGIYNGHVGYEDYDDPCDQDNINDTSLVSPNNTSSCP